MGSSDILEWLINQRKKANHSFFKTSEIATGLKEEGKSPNNVYAQIRGLNDFGFLEVEVENISFPKWRVKEQYVKKT